MNSHIWHQNNALILSVVVGKLMGVALGIALVDPTHRYTRLAPHLTPGPPLRSVTAVTVRRPYMSSYKPHIAAYQGPHVSLMAWEGTSSEWQPRPIMSQP